MGLYVQVRVGEGHTFLQIELRHASGAMASGQTPCPRGRAKSGTPVQFMVLGRLPSGSPKGNEDRVSHGTDGLFPVSHRRSAGIGELWTRVTVVEGKGLSPSKP